MKKIIFSILIICTCFVLVGCGNSTSMDTKKVVEQGNKETKSDEKSNFELYSTDERLVFNANDLYYIVIDFGDNGYATSLKWMYSYNDAAFAKTMVATIKANMDENTEVKSVTQDGKYVVVEYKESAYADLERSSAEAAFSMYKEVENK